MFEDEIKGIRGHPMTENRRKACEGLEVWRIICNFAANYLKYGR